MHTKIRPPDLDDLFAQSDEREEYISVRELFEDLWQKKLDAHDPSRIEEMRGVVTNVVSHLLFNQGFFNTMYDMGIEPFFYQPCGPEQTCQVLYIHKEQLKEALMNEKFINLALQLDFLGTANALSALKGVEDLHRLICKMTGVGKTKLQEENLVAIESSLFERRAKPMMERMAQAFCPILTGDDFLISFGRLGL